MGFFLKGSKRGARGKQKKETRTYDMANQYYIRKRTQVGLSYKPNRRSKNNSFYLIPVELQEIVKGVQKQASFEEPERALLIFWQARKEAENRLAAFPREFMTEAHLANYDFFIEGTKKLVTAYFIAQAYGAENLLTKLQQLVEREGGILPDDLLEEIIVVSATAQAFVETREKF